MICEIRLEKCREIPIASHNSRDRDGFIGDLIENNIAIEQDST